MGLAVATSLSKKGWTVNIADLNVQRGEEAAAELLGSFFKADVNNYDSLSNVFDQVFQKYTKLNFVFANAGVGERKNFYAKTDNISCPPPELDSIIDIDLKSVINSAYLAQHYFRNVRTNLFDKNEWDAFDNKWIELSQIVKVVELMLFDEKMHGQVVEAAPENHYVVAPLEYNDPNVKRTLDGTVVDSIGK
ncbi:hypothetical protein V491_08209 [Pseudogymnoascus sp. VKM F-3775]|nr:hypothetical protein V491_08209 [Pseudogymnoascus sp. VKM F-3775]